MKSNSNKAKSPRKTLLDQEPPNPRTTNVLDTLNTITFSAQAPEDTDPRTLKRLIHDLRSAANAFSFLIGQLAFDLDKSPDDRHRRKMNQLRQHDAVNKNCMDAIIKCLERQLIQGVNCVPFNPPH